MKTLVEIIDEIGRRNPSFLNDRIAAGLTLTQIADKWQEEHFLDLVQTGPRDAQSVKQK